MAVIHIGIELKDRDFAIALARGISRQGGDFQVHVENARECDVLLTDRSEAEGVNFKGKSLFLTEKISSRTDKPNFIYKFEDSREIRRKILAIADTGYVSMNDSGSGKIKTSRNDRMGTKVIGFFGTSGGCGVTSSIVSIAAIAGSNFGERALYFNLQSLDTSETYFRRQGGGNSQEMFFMLQEDKIFAPEKFISRDSPDHIIRGRLDDFIENAGCEDIYTLISVIDEKMNYNYIFLDFGCDFSSRNRETAEKADCIVMVKSGKMNACDILSEEVTSILKNTGVLLMEINNYAVGEFCGYEMSQNIPYDRSAFIRTDGRIAMNLNSEYGKGMLNFVYKFEKLNAGV